MDIGNYGTLKYVILSEEIYSRNSQGYVQVDVGPQPISF